MPDQSRSHPASELATWHTGKLLSTAARLVEHAFDAGIAELGVTHAGIRILDALNTDAITQRELAGRCGVQDQTISRTIDGLERDGLVRRHRDPGDRRRVLVERTDDGALVLERALEVADKRLGALDEGSPEDGAAARRVLISIIARYGGDHWGNCAP
jgi:DNA-binding MarR family transcriptional regulator